MVVLPILFWCGYTRLARAYVAFQRLHEPSRSQVSSLVHVLAAGVFFSGFVKDLLCLPRPLSPPLQRITMSGSAALEYGFPSTHSTNAVSVAVYSLFVLGFEDAVGSPTLSTVLQTISYCYAFSIILGRIYCGMHGFLDVIVGSLLGAALAFVQFQFEEPFEAYIHSGSLEGVSLIILIILVLVRIHPEPADDCPCFDDSVAFAGVLIGIEFGNWHYARSGHSWSSPCPATVPFDINTMGWIVATLRIVIGILTIFAWREVMKPSLLRILPPAFRVIEALGLNLPRRFFMQASEYTKVPKNLKDDNVMPSVSEIPSLLSSIRRKRAVSVGPQSEADAYETLAYREKRRRDSISSMQAFSPLSSPSERQNGFFEENRSLNGSTDLGRPRSKSELDAYKSMMGTGFDLSATPGRQELEEKAMFSRLQKPRVRYDVEVVTKLIVYSGTFNNSSSQASSLIPSLLGIAWLAVEGNPLLFEVVGLGI